MFRSGTLYQAIEHARQRSAPPPVAPKTRTTTTRTQPVPTCRNRDLSLHLPVFLPALVAPYPIHIIVPSISHDCVHKVVLCSLLISPFPGRLAAVQLRLPP